MSLRAAIHQTIIIIMRIIMAMEPEMWSVALLVSIASLHIAAGAYLVSDSEGLGRRFDGIGGLSGGGVSIKVCTMILNSDCLLSLYCFRPLLVS